MTAYEELLAYAREAAPDLYRRVKLEDYEEENGCHFDEHYGKEAVARMHHTNQDGSQERGEHWNIDQVREATQPWQQRLPAGVTCWDKYVAVNMWYHDLGANYRRRMGNQYASALIEDALTWAFMDGDAPEGKLWYYVQMSQQPEE